MEYNKLIAVTGLPGLFELIASKNDGAIVRSLDDKTTKFVSSRIHNFSHLETIEVYTNQENVNLATVFEAMKANKTSLPDSKDGVATRKYFEKVYPDMDFERVFTSDMKKMIRWFEILNQNNIEIRLSEIDDEEEEPVESADTTAAEKPEAEKKKSASKAGEAEKSTAQVKTAKAEKAAEPEPADKKGSAKAAEKEKPASSVKEKADGKKAPAKKAAGGAAKEDAVPKKPAASKEPKSATSKSGKDAGEAPKKKAAGRKKADD